MVQPISHLLISGITPSSTVNGPGSRTVLHTQGCDVKCPGCFNKHTWDASSGTARTTDSLAQEILSCSDAGLTLSGGEPMQQIYGLMELVKKVRAVRPSTDVLMFSGWSKAEIESKVDLDTLGNYIDVVIAGPYDQSLSKEGIVASSNQEVVYLTNRIPSELLTDSRIVEVICDGDEVVITGFPTKEERRNLLRELN